MSAESAAKEVSAELTALGMRQEHEVIGAFVRKIPFAYPVYDLDYAQNLKPIRAQLESLQNLWLAGRQGTFRYNNMDQSIDAGRELAWHLASLCPSLEASS